MKLYLMIALSALLSVGIGVGAGTYLQNGAQARSHDVVEISPEEEAESIIIPMGKMNVPIYRARSITYVLADINLSVQGTDNQELANVHADAIRAMMLETMVTFATEGKFNEEVIDQDALSLAMSDNINEAFGSTVVTDVLFASLLKQDINT